MFLDDLHEVRELELTTTQNVAVKYCPSEWSVGVVVSDAEFDGFGFHSRSGSGFLGITEHEERTVNLSELVTP